VDEINSIQVNAWDSTGAGFSSVAGLSFRWDILKNEKHSLKLVPASDTL